MIARDPTQWAGTVVYGLIALAALLAFGAWAASTDAGGRAVSFVELVLALGMVTGVCPVFPDLEPARDCVVVSRAEIAHARAKGWHV